MYCTIFGCHSVESSLISCCRSRSLSSTCRFSLLRFTSFTASSSPLSLSARNTEPKLPDPRLSPFFHEVGIWRAARRLRQAAAAAMARDGRAPAAGRTFGV